jgi:hypothetical protein
MHNPTLAPSSVARFRSTLLFASLSAFAFACSSSAAPPSDDGTNTSTTGGATAGAGGSNSTSTTTTTGGLGGSSDTTAGSGGTSSGTGTAGTSSTGGTMSMGGPGGSTGAGGGVGPIGGPTIEYTVTGYNNATWAGGDTPGTIVVNPSGYLPMAASDCPLDPDMAMVAPYKDKIFNGCLDECAGDPNMAGHGKATVLDWNVKGAGWAVGQISSNLHWTGMWAPSTGTQPTALVFWIKGANGNEQDKFTIAIHSHLLDKLSTAFKVPIVITQAWQRVVMPFDNFKVPASPYPDALAFSAVGANKVTIFIDQAYLSKTVKIP